jgi:hypothetical protein
LTHARALDRDGAKIIRIEGPDGTVMLAKTLDAWLDSGPDMLD